MRNIYLVCRRERRVEGGQFGGAKVLFFFFLVCLSRGALAYVEWARQNPQQRALEQREDAF